MRVRRSYDFPQSERLGNFNERAKYELDELTMNLLSALEANLLSDQDEDVGEDETQEESSQSQNELRSLP